MSDAVDRLGDAWLAEAGANPEPEAVEAEPVEAQEPEAETPATEPPAQQADPVEPEEKFNPTLYREMKEERAKRQAAERDLQALKAQQTQQQPQAQQARLDAYEDPDGFNQHIDQKFALTEWNIRAGMSERFAIKEHGAELVNEATAWAVEAAKSDPGLAQRIFNDPDPAGVTIKEFQQSKTLQTIAGRSFDQAAKDYAIEQGWIVSPDAGQPAPSLKPSPPKPPRGLASTPGSGKAAPKDADWSEVKYALDR